MASLPSQAQNIIIDTDLGDDVDDVLALAFALLRPELNVKALTAVSYATEKRCHMLRQLLRVLGREDIPVGAGLNLPLRPASEQERQRLNPVNDYILNHYSIIQDDLEITAPAEDAIALMAHTVRESAGDIGLVAIGPLTNVATFLCRYPELGPV